MNFSLISNKVRKFFKYIFERLGISIELSRLQEIIFYEVKPQCTLVIVVVNYF